METLGQKVDEALVLNIIGQLLVNDKKIAAKELLVGQMIENLTCGHFIDNSADRPDISSTAIDSLLGSIHQMPHFFGSVLALSYVRCVSLIVSSVLVVDGVSVEIGNFDSWKVPISLFEKNVSRSDVPVDDA